MANRKTKNKIGAIVLPLAILIIVALIYMQPYFAGLRKYMRNDFSDHLTWVEAARQPVVKYHLFLWRQK